MRLLAIQALAVAAITLTITRGSIFAPLRRWLAGRVYDTQVNVKRNEMLFDLFTCPYCTAHWVSFVVVLPWHGFLQAFAVIALASAFMGVIVYSIRSIGPAAEDTSDHD
jgi:hypothetical protein